MENLTECCFKGEQCCFFCFFPSKPNKVLHHLQDATSSEWITTYESRATVVALQKKVIIRTVVMGLNTALYQTH